MASFALAVCFVIAISQHSSFYKIRWDSHRQAKREALFAQHVFAQPALPNSFEGDAGVVAAIRESYRSAQTFQSDAADVYAFERDGSAGRSLTEQNQLKLEGALTALRLDNHTATLHQHRLRLPALLSLARSPVRWHMSVVEDAGLPLPAADELRLGMLLLGQDRQVRESSEFLTPEFCSLNGTVQRDSLFFATRGMRTRV